MTSPETKPTITRPIILQSILRSNKVDRSCRWCPTTSGPQLSLSTEKLIDGLSLWAPTSDSHSVSPPKHNITVEQLYDLLEKKASAQKQPLNWRKSIVDLMKVLNLNSTAEARIKLAVNCGYQGDMNDSYKRNVWLHKYLIKLLEENGGDLEIIYTNPIMRN